MTSSLFLFFNYHNDALSNKHQIHKFCLTGSFLRRYDFVRAFLCQMFQLPSSSLVATLRIVHHEILLCSMMG